MIRDDVENRAALRLDIIRLRADDANLVMAVGQAIGRKRHLLAARGTGDTRAVDEPIEAVDLRSS